MTLQDATFFVMCLVPAHPWNQRQAGGVTPTCFWRNLLGRISAALSRQEDAYHHLWSIPLSLYIHIYMYKYICIYCYLTIYLRICLSLIVYISYCCICLSIRRFIHPIVKAWSTELSWLLPVRNGISWNEFPEKPATDLQYGSPVPLL